MNLTQRIQFQRERIQKLPQWWKEREMASGAVNPMCTALNDLDHADAYSKMEGLTEDAEARLVSATAYVDRVQERIDDWASDPLP